ncbi:MAG: hypothetical protein ETSY1_32910 [Candidatus Entotheonella factor]|uniref:Solute-binding protein family 5 domain-containing protein n=1 Tax=Entotheonella factor TaxID=1429438 RepID=W4LC47_ENTF1|nr:MAG: hypothetical protein ETSY1_32910 [Candidatus Entotheonella factor]
MVGHVPQDHLQHLTRRDTLKAGTGLGVAALSMAAQPALAADEKRGGHLVVLNYAYPEVWDPHLAGTLGALASISPVYNQVVEFNPLKPDEVIGDLAKSWDVEDDGLTYIFHLHQGVKWADGQELTADDVVFSILRMIKPGEPRPRVGLLRPSTKTAEAVDKYTVKVTLNYPSPSFIKFLAVDYMKVVPKHVVEAGKDINRWQNIVGSGPFIIKRSRRGDSTQYDRNPNYFKAGRPYLDKLTVMNMSDAGTASAAIKAGKIQATTAVTAIGVEDALKLEQSMPDKLKVFFQAMNAGNHFFANVEREPWKDLRIIRALRYATDQQELQQAFGEGRYQLGAPFPVGSWYGSSVEDLQKLPGYRQPKDQDIADAKKLLQEAGYETPAKLGKRILTTPTAGQAVDIAQLWVAQMRRNLGLEIEMKITDTPAAVTSYVAGDFDLGVWGYGFNIADPDDWVNAIYGPGSRNYTRWKNPKFIEMFDKQSRELDPDKRKALLREMEQFLLTEEAPYIQIQWVPWYYVVNNQVTTEAGPYIPAETIQTALKWDHVWLKS